MAGYPGLGRLTDLTTRDVCKKLFDLVGDLQRQITALEAQVVQHASNQPVDMGGVRVTRVASPAIGTDAVNLSYLRAYVAGQLTTVSGGAADEATDGGAGAPPSVESVLGRISLRG